MEPYSNEYIADIHFIYGFCNGNANEAVREYARRYPNRPTPNARTFIRIHLSIAENGIRRPSNERGRLLSLRYEEEILEIIAENPGLSVRRIATRLGLSKMSVWRVLKKEGLHPYHFRRVQELNEPDFLRRLVFASWINRRVRSDPNFCKKNLWTDEATFTRSGYVNHRNEHLWLQENPHAVKDSSYQHQFSVNVWAGIIDDVLIGPIILPATMNGPRFLEFLQTDFLDALLELPIHYRSGMLLQMDGAPAHFAVSVRNYVNENYAPWIGRGGTISWPPRSPDLTPLDFFLWGTIKQKVYVEVPNTREQLIDKILQVANELREDKEMIRRSTQNISIRAMACLQHSGGHFEQWL